MASIAEELMAQGVNPYDTMVVDSIENLLNAVMGAGIGMGLSAHGDRSRIDTELAIRSAAYALETAERLIREGKIYAQ